MLREWNSIVNGWLPDSLIWFFVSMAAYRLMKPNLKNFVKRLASSQFPPTTGGNDSGSDTKFKPKSGAARIAGLTTLIVCLVLMVAASISIPVERAVSADQIVTAHDLYLPHVDQEMDQYHFYADPGGDVSRRMLLTFCPDRGFKPQFDEGETLKAMKYRAWPTCLELLGVTGLRDAHGKLIER